MDCLFQLKDRRTQPSVESVILNRWFVFIRANKAHAQTGKEALDVNQTKIGKFIASCRKERGMTQAGLAEMLGVSDRAVSKWETGRSMPDSSIMLELCGHLGIDANELLSGERIRMEKRDERVQENLLQLKKREEEANGRLLRLEVVFGTIGAVAYVVFVLAAIFCAQDWLWRTVFIASALAFFAVGMCFAIKIEREAGYYRCSNCGHVYVPVRRQHWTARHRRRNRLMVCPSCGEKCWAEKVVSKD